MEQAQGWKFWGVMAIKLDVGPTAELWCVSILCSNTRFTYSTVGVLGLLPWFRPTRPHSTRPSAPAPPDQSPPTCSGRTSEPQPSGPESDPPAPRLPEEPKNDTIKKLMLSPALFDPIRTPRYPIVLCHGGYSTLLRAMASRVNRKTSRIIRIRR